jgi:hypothetical protein
MPMSQEHKEALARGRRESRAIKKYLEALSTKRKPGRPVTPETLRKRISTLEERIAAEADPLKAVELRQERIEAEEALAQAEATEDLDALEIAFVEHARGYSERKNIGYAAWRESGVPAAVLKKAGISRGSSR